MDGRIHTLVPEEWERFREIRLRALRSDPDAFGSTLEKELAYPQERWVKRLANPDSVNFVAVFEPHGDVGLVAGAPYGESGDAGLFSMWVDPVARRQGLAMALVQAVEDWAREKGYPRLKLDVADENTGAIRLYEHAGFAPNGETCTMCPPREQISEHQRVKPLQ